MRSHDVRERSRWIAHLQITSWVALGQWMVCSMKRRQARVDSGRLSRGQETFMGETFLVSVLFTISISIRRAFSRGNAKRVVYDCLNCVLLRL